MFIVKLYLTLGAVIFLNSDQSTTDVKYYYFVEVTLLRPIRVPSGLDEVSESLQLGLTLVIVG